MIYAEMLKIPEYTIMIIVGKPKIIITMMQLDT
jgi:hypothetical protein